MNVKFFFEYGRDYVPKGKRKPRREPVFTNYDVEVKEVTEAEAPVVAVEATVRRYNNQTHKLEKREILLEALEQNDPEDHLVAPPRTEEPDSIVLIDWRFYAGDFWVENGLEPTAYWRDRTQSKEEYPLQAEYYSRDRVLSPDHIFNKRWPYTCPVPDWSYQNLEQAQKMLDNWASERIVIAGKIFKKSKGEPMYYFCARESYPRAYTYKVADTSYVGGSVKELFSVTPAGEAEIQAEIDALIEAGVNPNYFKWTSAWQIIDPTPFTYDRQAQIALKEAKEKEMRYIACRKELERGVKDDNEGVEFIKRLYLEKVEQQQQQQQQPN